MSRRKETPVSRPIDIRTPATCRSKSPCPPVDGPPFTWNRRADDDGDKPKPPSVVNVMSTPSDAAPVKGTLPSAPWSPARRRWSRTSRRAVPTPRNVVRQGTAGSLRIGDDRRSTRSGTSSPRAKFIEVANVTIAPSTPPVSTIQHLEGWHPPRLGLRERARSDRADGVAPTRDCPQSRPPESSIAVLTRPRSPVTAARLRLYAGSGRRVPGTHWRHRAKPQRVQREVDGLDIRHRRTRRQARPRPPVRSSTRSASRRAPSPAAYVNTSRLAPVIPVQDGDVIVITASEQRASIGGVPLQAGQETACRHLRVACTRSIEPQPARHVRRRWTVRRRMSATITVNVDGGPDMSYLGPTDRPQRQRGHFDSVVQIYR